MALHDGQWLIKISTQIHMVKILLDHHVVSHIHGEDFIRPPCYMSHHLHYRVIAHWINAFAYSADAFSLLDGLA